MSGDELINIDHDVCSICLCDINLIYTTTGCNHIFHTECINNWIKDNETCPVCRTILKPVDSEEIPENELDYNRHPSNRMFHLWWMVYFMILLGLIGFLLFNYFS